MTLIIRNEQITYLVKYGSGSKPATVCFRSHNWNIACKSRPCKTASSSAIAAIVPNRQLFHFNLQSHLIRCSHKQITNCHTFERKLNLLHVIDA